MAAGHVLSLGNYNRKLAADLRRKHHKWPLGTQVLVKTADGYLRGRVFKHWRKDEVAHGASVEFPFVVDMGDANGERICHVIPFRSLKRVQSRYGKTEDGKLIVAPAGWRLLKEGEPVPRAHRNCANNGVWCQPHIGHTTMTPFTARECGWVRAIAVPEGVPAE